MNAQLVQWLADLRPLMAVLVVDLELAAAQDRWLRDGAGPWGGQLNAEELDDLATQYARAWRNLATGATTVLTVETDAAKVVLQAADAQRVIAFSFDPKTPLGLARLHVLRAMPQVRAGLPADEVPPEQASPRPTGPPVTASYEGNPAGVDDDGAIEPLSETPDERPGLPPPTHPPGPPPGRHPTPTPPGPLAFQPTPAPPGPVPLPAGPVPTKPGVGLTPHASPRSKQPAPTLTSADHFTTKSIEDAETEPGNLEDELPPDTRVRREGHDPGESAQYAGPVAGATRPTTTLTEASSETAARGVRVLAYLDAHAEDAHLAVLRVSLQTGLSVERLRDPENLTDDEVDFVAASVRRILGRPLEM